MDPLEEQLNVISNILSLHKDEILKSVNLHERTTGQASRRSIRLPDGSYVDEAGNPISAAPQGTGIPPEFLQDPNQYPGTQQPNLPPSLISDPNQYPAPQPQPQDPFTLVEPDGSPRQPDRTPPGYVPGTSPSQPVYPTTTGAKPGVPGVDDTFGPPSPNPTVSATPIDDTEKTKYSAAREAYYRRRNQQEKDEAEERLAVMRTLDTSKMSASGRAQLERNRLRAERALKRDKFSDEDIARMTASDTKERFLSPEEKKARAERNAAAVAALTAEAETRYGPGGGVTTIDRRGDNKIQGTNMTFNQFRERYGRDYNALSNDDANLVRGAASNFAVGRVSQSAQQAAQTADAMNQAYATQNAELRKREGQLDRAVDASKIELDRYRNLTPAQRQAEVRAEIQRTQAQPGFVQGVAQDMATGVSAETARRAAEAERQAFERRAAQPGRVGIPSLLARPEQAPTLNTPQLLSRPEGSPPEAPSLLQAPFAQPPARPSYTGAGSIDYGKAPDLLQAPENQIPPYRGIGSLTYSPAPAEKTVGGQVTQRASTMNAQPMSGRVSPTAPVAAPRQPLGATITPSARQQPMPQPTASQGVTNTGGMNATGSISDFDKEQQTGGPSEANRAIPSPSQNAFAAAQRQPRIRGGAVTRAARTFRANARVA